MPKDPDVIRHVRGESEYVADFRLPAGTLHAAPVLSDSAHGRILKIDAEAARRLPGTAAVLTAADIPGENQVGSIIPDEPLLADGEVHFVGQPVALVVADSVKAARAAARLVRVETEPLPAVFDPREAYAAGSLIAPQRTFALGDAEAAMAGCTVVAEGRIEIGGQEHLYLETQGAVALPTDSGLKILSATQSPTAVQRGAAKVLGLSMNAIEVDVLRLGGAFGGKEDQATTWSCLAALAARRLRRPVSLILSRHEDMVATGKRHPYSVDYRLGMDAAGNFLAYEATFYQNAGAAADLSTSILERTLFHCTGAYRIPNVRVTAAACRTNLPPNTAFRGFGGPQAMVAIEAAIRLLARKSGLDPVDLQDRNLLAAGDEFPYGMRLKGNNLRRSFDLARERFAPEALKAEATGFNAAHPFEKRGVAVMPLCFGIAFTAGFLNQSSATVHVYTDGSVCVSTAAVEMGQGVNAKMREVAARVLGIDIGRVRVESTNTYRIANTSPTAASTGADLNGQAVRLACEAIRQRLKASVASALGVDPETVEIGEAVRSGGFPSGVDWPQAVNAAYLSRISLSAHAHYSTPDLHFDKAKEKGEPFAYHVTGTAVVGATVDAVRGTYSVDFLKAVHDVGRSLSEPIDRGQVEGAAVQGIGWLTTEELGRSADGRLLQADLATYKVPDIYDAPREIETVFLEAEPNSYAPFDSKAIGEPPLMYGIGAYFALLDAILAANPAADISRLVTPLTPERVMTTLNERPVRSGD